MTAGFWQWILQSLVMEYASHLYFSFSSPAARLPWQLCALSNGCGFPAVPSRFLPSWKLPCDHTPPSLLPGNPSREGKRPSSQVCPWSVPGAPTVTLGEQGPLCQDPSERRRTHLGRRCFQWEVSRSDCICSKVQREWSLFIQYIFTNHFTSVWGIQMIRGHLYHILVGEACI